jgi:hypothetical protein
MPVVSAKDADASMASFASAPAAKDFMSNIDASTLAMTRYTQPQRGKKKSTKIASTGSTSSLPPSNT